MPCRVLIAFNCKAHVVLIAWLTFSIISLHRWMELLEESNSLVYWLISMCNVEDPNLGTTESLSIRMEEVMRESWIFGLQSEYCESREGIEFLTWGALFLWWVSRYLSQEYALIQPMIIACCPVVMMAPACSCKHAIFWCGRWSQLEFKRSMCVLSKGIHAFFTRCAW